MAPSSSKKEKVDPTAQAWERLFKNMRENAFVLAPLAVVAVVGLAFNLLPSPFNIIFGLGILAAVGFTIVPRLVASNEPTEAEIMEADKSAEELTRYLDEVEAKKQAELRKKEEMKLEKKKRRLEEEDRQRKEQEQKRREEEARRRAERGDDDDEMDEDDAMDEAYVRRANGATGESVARALGADDDEDGEASAAAAGRTHRGGAAADDDDDEDDDMTESALRMFVKHQNR